MKSFTEAMKLQKELTAGLAANLDKLRGEKAVTLSATVKEQEKLIAEAKTELADSEKEKKISLRNWDMRISQGKATVERLEKGLKEMKHKLEEMEKGRRTKVVRPKKK